MSEWQSIETAPKDGTAIWILVNGVPALGYCRPKDWLSKDDTWFAKASFCRRVRTKSITNDEIFGCYGHGLTPTHWMPLPDADERPTQLCDALRQLIGWVEECGSAHEGREYVLTAARSALRNMKSIKTPCSPDASENSETP